MATVGASLLGTVVQIQNLLMAGLLAACLSLSSRSFLLLVLDRGRVWRGWSSALLFLGTLTLMRAGFVGLTADRPVLLVDVTGETGTRVIRGQSPGGLSST